VYLKGLAQSKGEFYTPKQQKKGHRNVDLEKHPFQNFQCIILSLPPLHAERRNFIAQNIIHKFPNFRELKMSCISFCTAISTSCHYMSNTVNTSRLWIAWCLQLDASNLLCKWLEPYNLEYVTTDKN